ncbi:MAG: hypothetical protein K2X03_13930 [Bryobacteraceae bacterium]|nr:hypothetical protein [Bryobacteraceae bacterium]
MTLFGVIWVTALFSQTTNYTISTLAGTNPTGDGGRARDARLFRPEGIVVDAQGVIYFCDRGNGRIRRVGRDQVITTIAGGGEVAATDGIDATTARIFDPYGIALNATANVLYFSDLVASTVYSVNLSTGQLAVVAGTGVEGFAGDGGAARRAPLRRPRGLAYDTAVGLVIADTGNHRVRRVDVTTGVISAFAGIGTRGFSGDGATATAGQLSSPFGVAIGADRAVYIADWGNSRIRRVRLDGTMDTVAGNGRALFMGDGGSATSAGVDGYHVSVAVDGTLYLTDQLFYRIRRVTAAGIISTVGGTGNYGFAGDGGIATTAQFDGPTATAVDASGGLLVADSGNHRLRRITLANQNIDTAAGRSRFGGDGGPALQTFFTSPQDVAIDANGNVFVADTGNHVIRRIGRDGLASTVAGVGGEAGKGAENVAATTSRLDRPTAVVVDSDGSLYIADRGNFRVRRVDPSGIVRTLTGNDNYGVKDMVLQPQQRRLYFTDEIFNQVLFLDLAAGTPVPVVVAGNPSGRPGFNGDGGPAISALLDSPDGIAIAPNGEVFFVDSNNMRLRRIDSSGVITTVAGNGQIEVTQTDGPVTSAVLSLPSRLLIDSQSNIFLSEEFGRIRRISGGRIDTIAGQFGAGFAGDGGPARQARFDTPAGIALAADGSLLVADSNNHRLRLLTPTTTPVAPVAARLEIRSGNNQSGATGGLLPQALSVAAVSATNVAVAAVPIAFSVTTGTATLSAATVNTGSDGLASITVTLGATAGPVQITARTGTLTPVVFSLTATAAPVVPPVTIVRPAISRGGILGVGTSVPAVTTISPRGIITIFGQNFLEAGVTGRRVDFATEAVGGILPTRLLGVCVDIGGTRAPMLDVFGTQLNVVVPALAGPTAAVRVIRRCDSPEAVTSDPETVPVATTAPEFLYSQLNQDGRNPVAAVNAVTGALIGPAALPGFTPAQAGDILTFYATGFGATDPAIPAGGTSAGVAAVTAAVRVRIGSTDLAPADILYVGASPGSLIYQVNLRVPAGLVDGNLPVQIFLGGVASPPNAYLAIVGSTGAALAPSVQDQLLQIYRHRQASRERPELKP